MKHNDLVSRWGSHNEAVGRSAGVDGSSLQRVSERVSLAPPQPGLVPAPIPPPVLNGVAVASAPPDSSPDSPSASAHRPSRRRGSGGGNPNHDHSHNGRRRNTLFVAALVGVVALLGLGAALVHRIRSAPSAVGPVATTGSATAESSTATSTATSLAEPTSPGSTTAAAPASTSAAITISPSGTGASSVTTTAPASASATTNVASSTNAASTTATTAYPIVLATKAARDRAEAVAHEFVGALSAHNWGRAGALQPSLGADDAKWAALYQPLVVTDFVPLRADDAGSDSVNLFVGQISVKVVEPDTATATSATGSATTAAAGSVQTVTDLSCAMYRIDVTKGQVLDIISWLVETRVGSVNLADVSTQLRGCVPAT